MDFGFTGSSEESSEAADDGIGTSDDETNSNSSTNSTQESTSPNMSAQSRRVIKLDLAAMSQLLTFDEVRTEELSMDKCLVNVYEEIFNLFKIAC